jgi:hypothetical protein
MPGCRSLQVTLQPTSGSPHACKRPGHLSINSRHANKRHGYVALVEWVKNKEKGAKLMGFGHRVYKNYDFCRIGAPDRRLVEEPRGWHAAFVYASWRERLRPAMVRAG